MRNSRIESFNLPSNVSNHNLFVKRDDLIHPEISGNKLRKLKWNLIKALDENCDAVLTFGGAFSNHLLATAAAGQELGISVIGHVRGEELNETSNHVLARCAALGMELNFLSRSGFSNAKKETGIIYKNERKIWVIPEGGANQEGIIGCSEIVQELEGTFDFYLLAQGTTTTSLGLLRSIPDHAKLIVVPVLKGFDVLTEMRNLFNNDEQFHLLRDKLIIWDAYHHGGYAKASKELRKFIDDFHGINHFQIEPVYTGKVLYALNENLPDFFEGEGKSILFVHTGGVFH
jgi:1-aminocyclopropane-1-carboxylate deaminase